MFDLAVSFKDAADGGKDASLGTVYQRLCDNQSMGIFHGKTTQSVWEP